MSELTDNYNLVNNNLKEAAKKAKRNPDEVTLIAVSKTKPSSMI